MGPNGRVDEHAIFIEALECDSDSARRALLESRCGGDEALRHRIDRLLELYAGSGDFLEEPVASRPAPPDNLYQPGTQIDGYELLEQIGEGGMGVVFAAKQETPIQRTVALKILKPGMDSRRLLARFDAERQVLALMDHPNIARVLDAGTTSLGHPYFVMEVVRGVPITEYCLARKLDIKARLRLFLTVCDAVQHAHQKGIIHRDLKPSNILVTDGDDRAFVKVIDFGIAKAIDCQLSIHSTLTGVSQVIGTPLYMSPEQAESGNLDIDTRSDIYSLGTVLYELLTDTTPFDTERLNTAIPNEMLRIIRSEEPPAPSARVEASASKSKRGECDEPAESPRWSHTLRGELDWIVMKSLDKDRARRYQTAKEFADDVRRYLDGEAVSACPPSILYRFRKTLHNHYRAVLTIAGAVLLLVVAATATSVMAIRASRAERQATEAQVKAETEAAVAAAISDFLRNELLGQANPYENPDRELSLREVLDRASSRISSHFTGQPLVEAEIRMTLATAYLHLGEFDQAESHFQHARRLRAKQLGSLHRETLKADYFLARVTFEKQGPATATDWFHRVLQAQETSLGRHDPDTLVTMDWLAWCYALQSRFSESEALYGEASTELRRKLGDTHPDTLDCLEGLAQLYAFEEKYAEAEELQQSILEDRRRVLGEQHPQFLDSLSCLGDIKMLRGDTNGALELYQRAADVRRRVQGELHPQTLNDRTRVNQVLVRLNDFQAAERRFEETLRVQRERLGNHDERTLFTMRRLAAVYKAQGQFEQARSLLTRALAARIESVGRSDELSLGMMRQLATVHLWLGEYDEARRLRKTALDLRRAMHGERHPLYVIALLDYAHILQESRMYVEAERVARQAIDIQVGLTGNESPEVFRARLRLGYVLKKARKLDEAIQVFRELWTKGSLAWGPRHRQTATAGNQLATVLIQQGLWRDAEPIALEALQMRRSLFGDTRLDTAYSLELLAMISMELGRPAEAIEFADQVLRVRRFVQGDCHRDSVAALTTFRRYVERVESSGHTDITAPTRLRINKWLLEFITTQEERLGRPTDPLIVELSQTAASHKAAERLELAEPLYRELLRIRRQHSGKDAPTTLLALQDLFGVLEQQGRLEDAVPLAEEMFATRRHIHGDESDETASAMRELERLARECERRREWKLALTIHGKIHEWHLATQGPHSRAAIRSLSAIACCHELSGDWEKAYEARSRELGLRSDSSVPSTRPLMCMILVSETLLQLGRLPEAESQVRKCLELCAPSKPGARGAIFSNAILAEIHLRRGDRTGAESILERCHEGLAELAKGRNSRQIWVDRVPHSIVWRLRHRRFFDRLASLAGDLERPKFQDFWIEKRDAIDDVSHSSRFTELHLRQ